MTKRAVFIGRWTPFHKGHLKIMEEKIKQKKPLLILVRDTPYDAYPPELRKRMIESTMSELNIDAKVMIIDDIESVNYGRGVGYEVNEIEVPENIKRISATQIREMISKGDNSWKNYIPAGADGVLESYLNKKGIVVWFTGLPKSGKSTISAQVQDMLEKSGIRVERITGGYLRKIVSKDLGFSKKDRDTNLERATFIAELLARNGAVVLCSFVTPYESERVRIKKQLEKSAIFIEAYVKSSIENCKMRDTEGIYKKAETCGIEYFTGISDPYEEPKRPDIVLDTDNRSTREMAEEVVHLVEKMIL